MLLVEITIGGTLHRISNEHLPLEHYYDAKVASLGNLRIGCEYESGGYMRPEYGEIELLPDLFSTLPPTSCTVTIKITSTTEAAAVTIFAGTAHLQEIRRDGVVYGLYGPEHGDVEAEGTSLNTTLDSLFSTYLPSGLTLDTTASRSPSPAVVYTLPHDIMTLSLLSKAAAFWSHGFYLQNNTLYLVDLLADNGVTTLTEFDIFPSEYVQADPVQLLTADDVSIAGSHKYGSEYLADKYHTDQTTTETALAGIKTLIERPRPTLYAPPSFCPALGERLEFVDASLQWETDVWLRVHAASWDFDQEQVVIEGRGGLA